MTLDEQQPIERNIGPFTFELAHARDPSERERVLTPVRSIDDRIPRINDSDRHR
jgi:hypothetical protein